MLTLYRRHTTACDQKLTAAGVPPRAKRHYKSCDCPIWIYGRTDAETFPRSSLGITDWKAAEAVRDSYASRGKSQAVHGPRIEDCAARFITARKNELGDKAIGQYENLLGKLSAYCAKRSVYFMRELTTDLLEDFKAEGLPTLADTTKGIAVAKVRCFLREAFRRDWISTHLAERVRPHHAAREQKEPYTDAEIDLILAESLKMNGGRAGYAGNPATFRLLLELMLETGLRVSDAIRFDPAKLERGESMWIYTHTQTKRKKGATPPPVETFLTDELKSAIDKCTWLSTARPFWYGPESAGYALGYQVYDRMQTLGKRCGIADCRPHRLRDTFAVRALTARV